MWSKLINFDHSKNGITLYLIKHLIGFGLSIYLLVYYVDGLIIFFEQLYSEIMMWGHYLLVEHILIFIVVTALTGLLWCLIAPINDIIFYGFWTSIVLLALVIWLITFFNNNLFIFQFSYELINLYPFNLSLTFGIDGISLCFLLLSVIVFPICFIFNWSVDYLPRQFFVFLLILEILLILTFITTDIFFFYIFFESILIPMFLMIGIWGSRTRKIKAAYYFFLYTLFGSLFMLFGLIYMYYITGSANYDIILNYNFTLWQEYVLWCCFFVTFAAKIPMFPFHLWLPEAHVEAPTIGSVILASLLLKLGGYGFLRFSLSMLPNASIFFLDLISILCIISIVFGSLTAIRQIDLKKIIAYSSIAHMNLVVLGLFSFSQQGLEGSMYLMVAHGIVSSALFLCVGVVYDRHHTRLLKYYSGLVQIMPLFTICFFVFTLANMSFPGTSNFVGELLVLTGIFSNNTVYFLFAATSIVLSAIYSIWLFNRVCFGTLKLKYISSYIDLNRLEVASFIPLILLMLLLGIYSTPLIELIQNNIALINMKYSYVFN